MEIVKADIVADVNLNLQTDEGADALDFAINKTLRDLSNKGLLVGTDASQTLVDGSETLNYPTGFRSALAITLTDTANNENFPLIKLQGGQNEYRESIAFGSTITRPEWYSEFDDKIYLFGKARKVYTVLIEYRKNHAKDPDNIEFSTDFENVMFAGVTYWKAAQLTRLKALSLWLPIYQDEMRKVVLNRKQQPALLRG